MTIGIFSESLSASVFKTRTAFKNGEGVDTVGVVVSGDDVVAEH